MSEERKSCQEQELLILGTAQFGCNGSKIKFPILHPEVITGLMAELIEREYIEIGWKWICDDEWEVIIKGLTKRGWKRLNALSKELHLMD